MCMVSMDMYGYVKMCVIVCGHVWMCMVSVDMYGCVWLSMHVYVCMHVYEYVCRCVSSICPAPAPEIVRKSRNNP